VVQQETLVVQGVLARPSPPFTSGDRPVGVRGLLRTVLAVLVVEHRGG
jgi:hypothetical protein